MFYPSNLKHPYAYDEFDNYLSIDDAVKISKRKWYLDINKTVELIPNAFYEAKKKTAHWKVKVNQYLLINGEKHLYTIEKDSESYEHKKTKGEIISQGYFLMDEYKIFICNSREEFRICDSRFKADISCSLMCGTPCIIEVIKTSKISESKEEYLEKNEILTFTIYIDKDGNQLISRATYFGEPKISNINKSIQKGEGAILELRSWNEGQQEIINKEIHRFQKYLDERARKNTFTSIKSGEYIQYIASEIEQYENDQAEIERLESYIRSRNSDQAEIKQLERQIYEIAEGCKVEWFGSERINLKGKNKFNEILYWIS